MTVGGCQAWLDTDGQYLAAMLNTSFLYHCKALYHQTTTVQYELRVIYGAGRITGLRGATTTTVCVWPTDKSASEQCTPRLHLAG